MVKEYYAALDSSAGTQLDGVSGDRVLGLVAQAMGEDDGAVQHFEAPWPSAAKQVSDPSWPRLAATTRIR